jgi:hypothetical protein
MIKKMITMLVILSLFGFSTAYAHDPENDDQAAGIAVAAVLVFAVTTAILLASHDRQGEYRPSPRHSTNRPYDSRYNDNYRPRDGRYNDNYRPRDYRYNDNNRPRDYRYDNRYQGEYPDEGYWNKWEGR